MAKAADILPAGRNPSAPEGSVKPAPPPNPPKAQAAGEVGQRARELLAKELPEGLAADVRAGNIRYQWVADAIRAIAAALTGERNG